MTSSLSRLLSRFEIDRAAVYAVSVRLWQVVSGPVTLWLVASRFTEIEQGFYVTFSSVLAAQMLFELGLQTVLITLASHEWSGLKLGADGGVEGDSDNASRLGRLISQMSRWYLTCSLLFTLGIGAAGGLLFEGSDSSVDWQAPWTCLVLVNAVAFWLIPYQAILEGCQQVQAVQRMRLTMIVTSNLVTWSLIVGGAGLWCAVGASCMRVFWEIDLVTRRFGAFFRSLSHQRAAAALHWKADVLPLQWRIALQSIGLWFTMHLMTPVVFENHGEAAAGRLGLTWTLIMAVQSAGNAWSQTRLPRFGELVARDQREELDRLFVRITALSTAIVLIGGCCVVGLIAGLNWWGTPLANRLLPPLPAAFLVVGAAAFQVTVCQGYFIRAHRIDPFLGVSLTFFALTGLAVWYFGGRYGAFEATAAWSVLVALFYLPVNTVVWWRTRRALRS